jgi:hypothetical protein
LPNGLPSCGCSGKTHTRARARTHTHTRAHRVTHSHQHPSTTQVPLCLSIKLFSQVSMLFSTMDIQVIISAARVDIYSNVTHSIMRIIDVLSNCFFVHVYTRRMSSSFQGNNAGCTCATIQFISACNIRECGEYLYCLFICTRSIRVA